jgi:hypothetical protein
MRFPRRNKFVNERQGNRSPQRKNAKIKEKLMRMQREEELVEVLDTGLAGFD